MLFVLAEGIDMQSDETIEDLVDRLINESMLKNDIEDDEVKKRKPKPFRYLTDKEEIKAELEKIATVSVMKTSNAPKIFDSSRIAILGLGDVKTIESVLKKHEISRKFKEK
ncbi:MAG: hypothetical protein QHH15_07485 [Candidatus Thermoplasmatota archaeon]|jgi:hypothetical protein|nr:hypothetical protein [Candidatus Thermoplasmatota archaeon]